ncbi:hypothetical protein CHS0354_011460, partial [Potamilus streckersoni]
MKEKFKEELEQLTFRKLMKIPEQHLVIQEKSHRLLPSRKNPVFNISTIPSRLESVRLKEQTMQRR